MDHIQTLSELLALLPYPAFAVDGGTICQVNEAARQRQFTPGLALAPLLQTGQEAFEAYEDGCLYLTLAHCGVTWGATVKRHRKLTLFLLEQAQPSAALQAYALAARELRKPLGELVAAAEALHSPAVNRSIHQLLRLADSMADGYRYGTQAPHTVLQNLSALFGEVLEKAQHLAAAAGMTLHYRLPSQSIWALADASRIERAIYQMLSNAMKFSPAGATIECKLHQVGKCLSFSVRDWGQGIPAPGPGTVFSRYLREPGLEEALQGIGLGMLLIRSVAAQHGGAVLLEQPAGGGSRVTMTLRLQQDSVPGMPEITVPSGWDRGLVELSEVLPSSVYQNI